LKIGDLVELSAYGRKIQENQAYVKKLGMVQGIKEYTRLGAVRLSYAVSWFGSVKSSRHPRQDLKFYNKEVK
tara:strand:+ start:135 stop:350 length:216 start_codon:yes stop_codon:yes gene_type:complete